MKAYLFLKANPYYFFIGAFVFLLLAWFTNPNFKSTEQALPQSQEPSPQSFIIPDYQSKSSSPNEEETKPAETESSISPQPENTKGLELGGALTLFAQEAELHPGEIEDTELLKQAFANLQSLARREATRN